MKGSKTRKAKRQRGGDPNPTDILRVLSSYDLIVDRPNQIKHCLCQLKRFAPDFFHNKPIREYQFFLNLGRLQELVGDTTHPEIWWRPIKQILEIAHSEKSENSAIRTIHIERIKTFVSDLESLFGMQITNAEIARGCEYK
jgi:hypothetical protein